MKQAATRFQPPARLCGAFLVVFALWAPAAEADGRRMEEIALAWVAAHNSGDAAQMAAYRAAHREDTGPGWEEPFAGLVEELGRLEVNDVMIEGPGQLMLGVTSEHDGELTVTFDFSPQNAERVRKIRIDSSEGRPNGLPELTLPAGGDRAAQNVALGAYIERLVAADLFSGAVLIGEDNAVRFEGAYGLASREFKAPNTLDTRFDIGSITKDFTRVAIAQLIATGKLGMDDKVGRHLPEYPNAEVREKVTVRQLFEHASGLGDYFTDEWWQTPMGALRTHQDYIDIWGPKPLEYPPGEGRQYSNYGFTVLGAILESASGQGYFDYVAEHVFTPAGMTRTGFFATDDVESDVAVGYTLARHGGEPGTELKKNIYIEPAVGGPWGKTYATAGDLWLFWQALSHHQLTSPALTRWVVLDGPPPADLAAPADTSPILQVGLGGGGPGLGAEIEASDGRTIIVLANLDPPVSRDLARRLAEALDRASD